MNWRAELAQQDERGGGVYLGFEHAATKQYRNQIDIYLGSL